MKLPLRAIGSRFLSVSVGSAVIRIQPVSSSRLPWSSPHHLSGQRLLRPIRTDTRNIFRIGLEFHPIPGGSNLHPTRRLHSIGTETRTRSTTQSRDYQSESRTGLAQ